MGDRDAVVTSLTDAASPVYVAWAGTDVGTASVAGRRRPRTTRGSRSEAAQEKLQGAQKRVVRESSSCPFNE